MFVNLAAFNVDYIFSNYAALITVADKVHTMFPSRTINLVSIPMLGSRLKLTSIGNIVSAKESRQMAYGNFDSNNCRCTPTEIAESKVLVDLYDSLDRWDRFTVNYRSPAVILPLGFPMMVPTAGLPRRRN